MKKIMLFGRVAAGKTTLTQALRGEEIKYYKTQYVNYLDTVIDTPGEYTERRETSGALALYAYEADIVGLVLSANEPYSIFSPCLTSMVNREAIGIITGIDKPDANVERVYRWLQLAGCKKIFPVSSITGEGIAELAAYLKDDEDKLAATDGGTEEGGEGAMHSLPQTADEKKGGRKIIRKKPPKKLTSETKESKPKGLETYLL